MTGNHGFKIEVTERFRYDGGTFSWEHKSINCIALRVQPIVVSKRVWVHPHGRGCCGRWSGRLLIILTRISMSDLLLHSSHPEMRITEYHLSYIGPKMSRYFSASRVCVCVCVLCVCVTVCISLQSLHPLPLSVSLPPPSFPLFLILPHFSHGEKRGVFFLLDYRVFSACHKQKKIMGKNI
jgi:hypothetical protein